MLSLAAFGLFVLGAVVGAYWTPLGCFLRTHGVGDFVQKVAPGVGVIVAICVFTWQANRARYTMRIDLILKLEERFDSPQMRKTRADAARALQESEDTDADAVGELLDFLEQIGFLVSRHAIDLEAVYEYFDGWIVPYYQKTGAYRVRWRIDDDAPDLHSKLEELFQALVVRERRTTGGTPYRTSQQINEFLKSEAALSPKRLWPMGRR